MSDITDPEDPSNLWDLVSANLQGRLDGMWTLVRSTSPYEASFLRAGPGQGNMNCHFHPKTEQGEGQVTVRQYLGVMEMKIVKGFMESETPMNPEPKFGFLLIPAESPDFDPGSVHVQGSWKGMGVVLTLAHIVSPSGPDLYGRVAPFFVDSLESIIMLLQQAYRWALKQETERIAGLKEKAESGDAEACLQLGLAFWSSDSLVREEEDCIPWFEKAAKAGHAEAQYLLGVIYSDEEGLNDMEQAASWWKLAAVQSHAAASYCLACHYHGSDDDAVVADGDKLLKTAADLGHPKACFDYWGQLSDSNPPTLDPAKAADYLRKAAEGGVVRAMDVLAKALMTGEGVPKDAATAAEWLRKAHEAGSLFAACELGKMHEVGEGVEQDYAEAMSWYRRCAQPMRPDFEGISRLGRLVFNGMGTERSASDAIRIWNRAHGMFRSLGSFNLCHERLDLEVLDGFLVATDEDGARRVVLTGVETSCAFAELQDRMPALANLLRERLGDKVEGLLGLDRLTAGEGFAIDLREGAKGELWILRDKACPKQRFIRTLASVNDELCPVIVDTGSRYSYLGKQLTEGSSEKMPDFSILSGKLESFDAGLHALEVGIGGVRKLARFGNLPPHVAKPFFAETSTRAVIGLDFLLGTLSSWHQPDGLFEVST